MNLYFWNKKKVFLYFSTSLSLMQFFLFSVIDQMCSLWPLYKTHILAELQKFFMQILWHFRRNKDIHFRIWILCLKMFSLKSHLVLRVGTLYSSSLLVKNLANFGYSHCRLVDDYTTIRQLQMDKPLRNSLEMMDFCRMISAMEVFFYLRNELIFLLKPKARFGRVQKDPSLLPVSQTFVTTFKISTTDI